MRNVLRIRSGERSAAVATPSLMLSALEQTALGGVLILVLAGSFLLTQSPILPVLLLVVLLGGLVVRSPILSLYAVIFINVILTIRPRAEGAEGAPSTFDFLMGLCLAGIFAYWLVKIRLLQSKQLLVSPPQLLLAFFFAWASFSTISGVILGENSFSVVLREVLNLSPLMVLPILYERYVEPDSNIESGIFLAVLLAALITITGNALVMRRNIARAYYLFQTGRAVFDVTLSSFIILLMTSYLMISRNWRRSAIAITLLLIAGVGILISISRNHYFSTPCAMILVLALGTWKERRRAARHLTLAGLVAILCALPIILTSRLIRILLMGYFFRFTSVRYFRTDGSILNRLSEWRSEWLEITRSPILGHGFGAAFRIFDIFVGTHSWLTFSHSSYLWIMFKTGIVGFILFFSAYVWFLVKGFRLSKSPAISERARVVTRACVAFLIIILFDAYLGPVFDSKTDLIWVGLVWGYFLALERKFLQPIVAHSPSHERSILEMK